MGSVNLGSFAHIHNIDSGAINQLRDNAGHVVRDGVEGTLQIGSNSFKVSIVGGNVELAFASGNRLANRFRSDTLSRARIQLQGLYTQAVAEDDAAMLGKTRSLNSAVNEILDSDKIEIAHHRKPGSKVEIAHYGFSNRRDAALPQMKAICGEAGNVAIIDTYNSQCGIKWDEALLNYDVLISNIRNESLELKPEGSYTQEKLASWQAHLKDNINKVDIFGRIRENIAEAAKPNGKTTGWAGEIRRHGVDAALEMMVKKNFVSTHLASCSIGEREIKLFASVLKDLVNFEPNSKDPREAANERGWLITNRFYAIDGGDRLYLAFSDMVKAMFFRQTSKQGLSFFNKQGISVAFEWQRGDGKTITPADLQDKWWKTGGNIVDHKWSGAISFSEMRYVERNQFSNVTRVRGEP